MSVKYNWICGLLGVLAALSTHGSSPNAAAPSAKHIVLIAGAKSHGPGAHEYLKSVRLLKVLLDRAPNLSGVETEVYFDGWPSDPKVLDRADTIAFFSDGDDGSDSFHAPFATDKRMAILARQMQRGCGLVTFHFSTFVPPQYAQQLQEWTGGYFDWFSGHGEGGSYGQHNDTAHQKWHSTIRTVEADVEVASPAHPIAAGVSDFRLKEEFYYQLRFGQQDSRLTPILRVPALSAVPADQVVAWAVQRKDGGRGFGTSTGHFFDNWKNDSYRKLILNALVWTAGANVPAAGVQSTYASEDVVERALGPIPRPKADLAKYAWYTIVLLGVIAIIVLMIRRNPR